MKFFKKELKEEKPKNVYLIVVTTMTGDADDYHEIKIFAKDENELKRIIQYIRILEKMAPDWYDKCPSEIFCFWEKYFSDWFFSDGYWFDTYEYFDVYYFDENGKKYEVEVEYEPEDDLELKELMKKELCKNLN